MCIPWKYLVINCITLNRILALPVFQYSIFELGTYLIQDEVLVSKGCGCPQQWVALKGACTNGNYKLGYKLA